MELVLYPAIVLILTFWVQSFLIFMFEKRKRKKQKDMSIEQEYKRNMIVIIKILVALVVSVILAYYVGGIATLIIEGEKFR